MLLKEFNNSVRLFALSPHFQKPHRFAKPLETPDLCFQRESADFVMEKSCFCTDMQHFIDVNVLHISAKLFFSASEFVRITLITVDELQ